MQCIILRTSFYAYIRPGLYSIVCVSVCVKSIQYSERDVFALCFDTRTCAHHSPMQLYVHTLSGVLCFVCGLTVDVHITNTVDS